MGIHQHQKNVPKIFAKADGNPWTTNVQFYHENMWQNNDRVGKILHPIRETDGLYKLPHMSKCAETTNELLYLLNKIAS